jgi:hypothetical protein
MRKLLIVVIFALAAPVRADWAEVPLEVLVDEADLIVVGKVAKVQEGGFFIIGPNKSDHIVKQDVAVLEVSAILKASAQFGKTKVVHIGQSGLAKITSADIRFRAGQEGIWLLTKDPGPNKVVAMKDGLLVPDPERNVYWAKHPSQFQGEKEQKKLAALIETRAKVAGGKPTKGLVARAELVESPANFQVRFSLKNVTEKPITVCNYVGNLPLQVKWIGPDGMMFKSKHYNWLKAARIAALAERDFVVIQPGGVRFMGEIKFHPPTDKATNFDNVAQVGKHKVTAGFVNNEVGKQFGLENVWTGNVTANELTFSVK